MGLRAPESPHLSGGRHHGAGPAGCGAAERSWTGVGLHGFEGRVCHDGLQRLLAQWPAQELADALHGAAEILGAEEASAEGGDPRPGRGTIDPALITWLITH